ncbi:MAG TPA: TonB-dependent receptor [Croceibacterium sp.]|nr:TonB-dependent receptor [Croceibacterium sp.]
MKTALDTFSRQSGVPIIYQGNDVAGMRTPGYRGRAQARVALSAMLRGTGLRMHVDTSGAIAVARPRNGPKAGAGQTRERNSWLKPRTPDEAPVVREIVVTGTRVVRSGYDAPTPTTVLDRELIDGKSPTTIIDALVTLPVFRNSSTPGTAGVAQAGPSGQSFANLRGLGVTRTLVLLDGQRFVPSTSIGTVDIGLIPAGLIQRVDIVTGGASAAYGSDAVAGVVNFVLDNRLTGIRGSVEGGISQYGDNRTFRAELNAGASFGDSGHFVVSGEYVKASGVPLNARPDTEYPVARLIINQEWTPDNGQTRRLIAPYVYTRTASLGGVVVGGPLAGLEFGPGGSISQQPAGAFIGTSSHVLPGRFDDQAWDLSVSLSSLPQEKAALYARASWDVADGLSAYTTAIVARNRPGPFYSSPANTIISGNFIVQRDNAFLPGAVRSRMEELGLETISVGRYSEDFGASIVSRTNDTYRLVGGLQGDIGDGWKIDAYAQYGENRQTFLIERNWIRANIALAADAVDEGLARGGTANGNIVCRSTLSDPGNGCIPLNIFGPSGTRFDPVAPPSAGYIFGTTRAVLNTAQTVASISVSGEPVQNWAGPVSFVAGAEFRHEAARQNVDALSAASAFGLGNPKPLSGDVSVREVFAETVVPLVRDSSLMHRLDLNGAVRFTDYSTSGSVATWKAGFTWQPIEAVRLRMTRSRDIRAPNILELFSSPVMSTGGALDPFTNTSPTFQVSSLGNPDLLPERADALTAGIVFRPLSAPGLEFSIDYYNIEVLGAISTLLPADIINRCYLGSAELCQLITRSGGAITQIDNPYLNLQSLSTDGFDLELSYRRAVGRGTGFARVLANLTRSYIVSDGVTQIERAGDMSNGQPQSALNAMIGYRIDAFSVLADITRIGGGKYDNTFTDPTDINDNTIPPRAYLGLQASLDLGGESRKREVFFNISNVFNIRPPPVFVFSGGPGYERVGRSFRAGLRFAM